MKPPKALGRHTAATALIRNMLRWHLLWPPEADKLAFKIEAALKKRKLLR